MTRAHCKQASAKKHPTARATRRKLPQNINERLSNFLTSCTAIRTHHSHQTDRRQRLEISFEGARLHQDLDSVSPRIRDSRTSKWATSWSRVRQAMPKPFGRRFPPPSRASRILKVW